MTPWLLWFGETVVNAQQATLERVAFFIAKIRFYDRMRTRLNPRQAKVVERMFREGPDGFGVGSVPRTISPLPALHGRRRPAICRTSSRWVPLREQASGVRRAVLAAETPEPIGDLAHNSAIGGETTHPAEMACIAGRWGE